MKSTEIRDRFLRFFERQEIKHALAYLRLLGNPDDDTAFLRVVNFPTRGIGARSLENLQATAHQMNSSLYNAAASLTGKAGQTVTVLQQSSGGRGAVLSVIAGAAVMRCLYKAIIVLGISQEWEMVIIGAALLAAVATDEARVPAVDGCDLRHPLLDALHRARDDRVLARLDARHVDRHRARHLDSVIGRAAREPRRATSTGV